MSDKLVTNSLDATNDQINMLHYTVCNKILEQYYQIMKKIMVKFYNVIITDVNVNELYFSQKKVN